MQKLKICLLAAVAGVASAAQSSYADPITIQNASFELPGGNVQNNPFPSATNWTNSSFTENSLSVGVSGGDGDRYGGQVAGATMSQDLGVAYTLNTTYTLHVLLGDRDSDPNNPTGSATFGLAAGTALIFTPISTFTQVAHSDLTLHQYAPFTFTFTTGATVVPTGDIVIALGAQSDGRALYDGITLDATAVPEPATLGLLGLGAVSLLTRRRSL